MYSLNVSVSTVLRVDVNFVNASESLSSLTSKTDNIAFLFGSHSHYESSQPIKPVTLESIFKIPDGYRSSFYMEIC
jgi:hypothetical protein